MALFKKIAQDPSEGRGQTKNCPTCSGSGKFRIDHPSDPKKNKLADCPFCNGTGKVHK